MGDNEATRFLHDGWESVTTAQGTVDRPSSLSADLAWQSATVPGLASTPSGNLQDLDVWYRLKPGISGKRLLKFHGLATIVEGWLDDTSILQSRNMYLAQEIAVTLAPESELFLCFRSLNAVLSQPGGRSRWRPRMAQPSTLNGIRTTLLGHMPGWCPSVEIVGPWKAIESIDPAILRIENVTLKATYPGRDAGELSVSLRCSGDKTPKALYVSIAGRSLILQSGEDGFWCGQIALAGIEPWWPHTHGKPRLYEVVLQADEHKINLGRVGFRSIDLDKGMDGEGFALRVNGEKVFCRGACWTTPDLSHLQSNIDTCRPALQQMVDAGMNMVRVSGTFTYEGKAFFDVCDEIGLLVWQDFMFANFDYPVRDPDFVDSIRTEARQHLDKIGAAPSLAVLCGGSEVFQQAAMMGMPEKAWKNPIFEEILPQVCAEYRPDAIYVQNSPSGGILPFSTNAGVSHYYGVGAYMRPLADARRADVRFASECLAFANVPEQAMLDAHHNFPPIHHPAWKAAVPRDAGASWDFDDVRDHYLKTLFHCDPARLRYDNPQRYLELSRAVTAHLMSETFAEWRRAGSNCGGALVWFNKDLQPGAGWGVVDSTGEAKSPWHSMRQVLQPVQVLLIDEGLNGLDIHLLNETASSLECVLKLTCLRDGKVSVVHAERKLTLEPRSSQRINATELLGAFFDITYAYRFGAPSHDVVIAELLSEADKAPISQSSYFPAGMSLEQHDIGLSAKLQEDQNGWHLDLATERFARFVHIEDAAFRAQESWFHLPPGRMKRIRLYARTGGATKPCGQVRAINSISTAQYQG